MVLSSAQAGKRWRSFMQNSKKMGCKLRRFGSIERQKRKVYLKSKNISDTKEREYHIYI